MLVGGFVVSDPDTAKGTQSGFAVVGTPGPHPMSRPSLPPPSAALWGGWYANILDMSTFSTPQEQEVFLCENPLVQVLARIEQTTTMGELWPVVRAIDEQSVMQLNSPLLDDLRKVAREYIDNYGLNLGFVIDLTGSVYVASFCLDRGADYRTHHNGALRVAASNGYKDICTLLLDRGADVHAVDDYALRYAALNGHKDVCALLLRHGADPRAIEDYALRYAAWKGHKDICALLLDHGANVHAADNEALRVSTWNGHEETTALLQNYTTNVLKNG